MLWWRLQKLNIDTALLDSELAGLVHPAVLQLGLRYADGSIRGGNARCVAMLNTFRKLIKVQGCTFPPHPFFKTPLPLSNANPDSFEQR